MKCQNVVYFFIFGEAKWLREKIGTYGGVLGALMRTKLSFLESEIFNFRLQKGPYIILESEIENLIF